MGNWSEIIKALKNDQVGDFISYISSIHNEVGHKSAFKIKKVIADNTNEKGADSLKIIFFKQEDLDKHVSFLTKDNHCFLSFMVFEKSKSLMVEDREFPIYLECKFKEFKNNVLTINVTNVKFKRDLSS